MAEAMSEEQLAEIRAIADRDRWSTYCGHAGPRAMVTDLLAEVERLRAHLVAEHLAAEAAETENDALRAQLAEIGETREEFGVHWADKPEPSVYGDEGEARREVTGANSSDDVPNAVLKVRRAPGKWQDAE